MTLETYFQTHARAALACSGGVDSAYLLYAAHKYGAQVQPYYIQTAFQPQFERKDAEALCRQLHLTLRVLPVDILTDPQIAVNDRRRCYYCKRRIFGHILQAAAADGYDLVLDGTNASDDGADRPGMQALQELGIQSPLRLCGLDKARIRALSHQAGLFTWDKPAYACLATRITGGQPLSKSLLQQAEQSEQVLYDMGFRDFRVRIAPQQAKLQLCAHQMPLAIEKRAEILQALGAAFTTIVLDLEARL